MKKGSFAFLGGLFLLFSMDLISAQFYDYYGSGFSLSNLFSGIDSSTIILSLLFIIFFTLIYFATSKMFRGNKAVPVILSIAISLLIIYGINQYVNVQSLFSGFGINISEGALYTLSSILLIAFIGFMIFLIIKIKAIALLILGVVFIGLFFTNLFYSVTALIIGIGCLGIGIFWLVMSREKRVREGGRIGRRSGGSGYYDRGAGI